MVFSRTFFKPTILDLYLFRQFMGPFVLAIFGFALIALVDIMFYLVEIAVTSGIGFFTIIRLLVFKLPAVMILFFPMAVLFSVMLLLVRMIKDNEITVLRASGISTFRFTAPILLFTLLASYSSYLTNEKLVPLTNVISDRIIQDEIRKKPPPISENIVFKDSENRYFYIKHIQPDTYQLTDIMVIEKTSKYPRLTLAKSATWHDHSWTLFDGHIIDFDDQGFVQFMDQFSEFIIHVKQDIRHYFKRQKSAKEMDSKELKDRIDMLHRGGISTRHLKVEFHMKRSIPLACFIFSLIGIGFCLNFIHSSKDWWGVIIAICVSVLTVGFYFVLVAIFRAFAKDGLFTPFIGAWLPNLFYGVIGSTLLIYNYIKR